MDGSGSWGAVARVLEEVARAGRPAQLLIADAGTLSVYPAEDRYVTDIQQLDAVLCRSDAEVRMGSAVWAAAPASGLPLTELRWRAAYRAAEAQAGDHAAASHELLHLQAWPDLPRVPEELLAPLTRICGLLWRKPTVGYLVARIVDLPARDTAILLRVLQGFGCVSASGVPAARPGDEARPSPSGLAPEESEPAPVPSVVAKLWQRLLGLQPA